MNDQRSNYGRRLCEGGREGPNQRKAFYFLPFELEKMNHYGHRDIYMPSSEEGDYLLSDNKGKMMH